MVFGWNANSTAFLILLQRRVPDDMAALEEWRRDQYRRIDEAARIRHGDLCQAAQWLRGMLRQRGEWEASPKVGRPRKHSAPIKVHLR
jgi:hypothetical protein